MIDIHAALAGPLPAEITFRATVTSSPRFFLGSNTHAWHEAFDVRGDDGTALEIVDSFIGRMLNNIAAMSRVLDAVTVVVGMRPAVAITLVELGLTLTGVRTALNVDRGLEMIRGIIERGEREDDRRDR